MYGTLRRALVARKVDLDMDLYRATVEGLVERRGSTIRITEIEVHYVLPIGPGQREAAERALEYHPQGCPAHESVKDAIKITWTADIQERPAG